MPPKTLSIITDSKNYRWEIHLPRLSARCLSTAPTVPPVTSRSAPGRVSSATFIRKRHRPVLWSAFTRSCNFPSTSERTSTDGIVRAHTQLREEKSILVRKLFGSVVQSRADAVTGSRACVRQNYESNSRPTAADYFFRSGTAVSLLKISCRHALPTYYLSAVPSVSWWMLRENFLPISNSNFRWRTRS